MHQPHRPSPEDIGQMLTEVRARTEELVADLSDE
jgi:hypothetical protein